MKATQLLCIALLAACAGCNTTPPDTSAQDQSDIKALEDSFSAAVKARDINAIMTCYVSDPAMVVFDVVPPLQYIGTDAYRKDWQNVLDTYPGPAEISVAGLNITTGGNVAYASSVQRATFTDKTGKQVTMTARVTDGYKKVNGHWLIAHEHASIPVDLATLKADPNAK